MGHILCLLLLNLIYDLDRNVLLGGKFMTTPQEKCFAQGSNVMPVVCFELRFLTAKRWLGGGYSEVVGWLNMCLER